MHLPVRLGAVLNRTEEMSRYFSRCPSMSFPLFISNIKRHPKHFLMSSLVCLNKIIYPSTATETRINSTQRDGSIAYLKSVKLELQVFFLIEQLLESICEYNVGIVQSAVFLVKLIVLISIIICTIRAFLFQVTLRVVSVCTRHTKVGFVFLHVVGGLLVNTALQLYTRQLIQN